MSLDPNRHLNDCARPCSGDRLLDIPRATADRRPVCGKQDNNADLSSCKYPPYARGDGREAA